MKRSKSSKNQSTKRPRRSSASNQSNFDPPTNEEAMPAQIQVYSVIVPENTYSGDTIVIEVDSKEYEMVIPQCCSPGTELRIEVPVARQETVDEPDVVETIDEPDVASNGSDTLSFPSFLKIPLDVWDHQLIKFLGLKQVAIMRGVNKFFEPCWTRRFRLNLLPLRVPYDIETLDQAMRVIEILIDRKPGLPYSKEDPLVVKLDKGEHQITSSWADQYGVNLTTTLGITRSNVTFVGKGIDNTTVLGGFGIHDLENITFKEMTVTNTSLSGVGIRMGNAKVKLFDISFRGCDFAGLSIPSYPSATTTVVATHCEFANSAFGASVYGSLTSATFKNCVFNANQYDGIFVSHKVTVHLRGENTAIHSNKRDGICAYRSGKVIIHLPSHHNTSYNNGNEDRDTDGGGTITNVED